MPTLIRNFVRSFKRNRQGMAATEFALVAPVMITLYFGITELSDALTARSKVTILTSTAADLVAQAKVVNDGDMGEVFAALDEVMFPYSVTDTQVVITSLVYDSPGKTKVEWSKAKNATPRSNGAIVSVPSGLVSAGGSLIFAEVKHSYTSPAGKLIYGSIQISDTFYAKPRRSAKVCWSQC
jgi:Flp pilus assembly protein TadG